MNEIIEKLKDDKEYYGGVGKQYLSNSDIGALLNNPKEYGASREDTPIFAKGRYFHQLILEPKKAEEWEFVDVTTRNTKAYKEFIAENNIPFALLEKEGEEIRSWVVEMKSNIHFYDEIMHPNNEYEVPAIAEIKGRMWKGKADIITEDCIIDLKTTGDINKFKWSAKNYNYDSQCYIYQQLFGKPLVFFVIDKTTKMLGIFRPTEDFIRGGERKVEDAIDVYDKFFGDNSTEDVSSFIIEEELF
tara:strand:- start:2923 stop:3657 length:735 start_codon:yes stop_codon:yes gene_type:complete